MATKRKPIHTQNSTRRMNFRPSTESARAEAKGTKPTSTPASVQEVLVMMILHVCKKVLFYNINLKVGFYLAGVFIISLMADFLPMPKSYFSRSDNVFNQYFVKIGWFWTIVMSAPFLLLTAHTYCCGKRDRILKNHLPRIGIATFFWYTSTHLFNFIEANYGRCNNKQLDTKQLCLKNGYFWNGFDISGHAFILIYSSLILMEEGKAIIGWEAIKEYIRNEEHARAIRQTEPSTNPLRNLQPTEFNILKFSYVKFTPYVRGLFISMTILQVLWDVMLVCTMLYYHIMIEKFVSAALAILIWFFTYRFWFAHLKILPDLPGDGIFKYQKEKQEPPVMCPKRSNSITINGKQLPKFMGMPLYGLKREDDISPDPTEPTGFTMTQ